MLDSISIHNFKCFERCRVPFSKLTILSGLNGMGKSSLVQSLLLLRQSRSVGYLPDIGLALNGELTEIGSAKDALYENATDDIISFDLQFSGGGATWSFNYDREAEVLSPLARDPNSYGYSSNLFDDMFTYLTAERLGPRPYSVMADYAVRQQRRVGVRGEFAIHYLDVFKDEPVRNESTLHKVCAIAALTRSSRGMAWRAFVPARVLQRRDKPQWTLWGLRITSNQRRAYLTLTGPLTLDSDLRMCCP